MEIIIWDDQPMGRRPNDLLLPLGVEGAFFYAHPDPTTSSSTERSELQMEFGWDRSSIMLLYPELVAQGATGVRVANTDSYPTGDGFPERSSANRLAVIDLDRSMIVRTRKILSESARALGFDPAELAPTVVGLDPTVAYAFTLRPERRVLWSHMCVVFNVTYQLLLGMRDHVMIDIPIQRSMRSLRAILAASGGGGPSVAPAAILGALATYRATASPAAIALDSQHTGASRDWVESFGNLLDDELFAEFSRQKHDLGWSARVEGSLDRLNVLLRRLVRAPAFRGLVKAGQKFVGTSTGVPVDLISVEPMLKGAAFMPPIVDSSPAIRRARSIWMRSLRDRQPIEIQNELFEWLSADYLVDLMPASFTADLQTFIGMFSLRPPLRTEDLAPPISKQLRAPIRSAFDAQFLRRLASAPECAAHNTTLGLDAVTWRWAWKHGQLRFKLDVCCEEFLRHSAAHVLAYRD